MKRLSHFFAVLTFVATPMALANVNHNEGVIDEAYVAGFLSGAQLTDTEIIQKLELAGPQSDFVQRAYNTRVGERYPVQATYYAGFCIPDSTASQDVISAILDEVGNPKYVKEDKAEKVYQAVKAIFPCNH